MHAFDEDTQRSRAPQDPPEDMTEAQALSEREQHAARELNAELRARLDAAASDEQALRRALDGAGFRRATLQAAVDHIDGSATKTKVSGEIG